MRVRYEINELSSPIDGVYKYNVQRWTSIDGGQSWAYCGFGRYFKTREEAEKYKNDMEHGENDAKEP